MVRDGDLLDIPPDVVFSCLIDIVEEMEVTTEVDVDTVTVWDSETRDLEDVILKLKFFFFRLILNSSESVDVMLVEVLSVVEVFDVVVVVVVVVVDVVDVLSELYLIASSQDMSLALLL